MLQPISHWAGAPGSPVLLMEPIAPAEPQVEKTTSEVFTRLSAYRNVLQNQSLEASLFVYLLQGGSQSERDRLLCDLRALDGTRVVDLEREIERGQFLATIRRAAESGSALPEVN
ncbi:MAG: hypothetical protein KA712_06020 [Myxococcales bacterium]|nr:hypothetical protein [Myxococcales bacterium]